MSNSSEDNIRIYVMGSAYEVPRGLTIMDAMEHAGWRFIRGAGCRSGFCGACSTVYRQEGDYRLRFALACQTEAEDGMYLVQLPFTPAPRVSYTLADLNPDENVLLQHYPEIAPYLEAPNKSESTKRFLDLESVYPNQYRPSFLPKVLGCTLIVPQHESKLISIDQTSALIKLMRQSASLLFKRRDINVHLDVLKRLVYQSETYQLLAGKDLYEEPDKISLLMPGK